MPSPGMTSIVQFRVTRDDLRAANLTDEEANLLSDEDLVNMGKTLRDHYFHDLFLGEVAYVAETHLQDQRRAETAATEPTGKRNAFEFTRNEALFERMGNRHFLELMRAPNTTIHQADVSSNVWGEFLFVTASRADEGKRNAITFWGLGFHERRDRYLMDEWFWYETKPPSGEEDVVVSKADFEQIVNKRRGELEAYARGHSQSKEGELFDLIADLTDEDGAAAEMDDLGNLFDD